MSTAPPDTQPKRQAGVESWLANPWRRLLLLLLAALCLSALTTLIWIKAADELGEAGRELDWQGNFQSRWIFWTCWALATEPIVAVGRLCLRYGRHWSLMLLFQIPLSMLASKGLDYAVREVTQVVLGVPQQLPGGPPPRRVEERRRPARPMQPAPVPERMQREREAQRRRPVEERDLEREERRRERGRLQELEHFYRNRADFGLFFYWAILALGWGVRTYLVGRRQERTSAALEHDLTQAKLANLRNQLNPHFLFNSLHSVGGLIRKQEPEAALGMLSSLSSLLRASLESAKSAQSTLSRELALAEEFLAIESIRLGERLKLITRVEPKLGNTAVPALLLLPLVENAIKYGIAPRSEGGTLEISAWREEPYVFLEVLDDGPGFDERTLAGDILPSGRRSSIGIRNTQERLAGLYSDAGVLQLSNRPSGGARALVRVPAKDLHDE